MQADVALLIRSQGFVVVGSGMAVHSFDSIEEIYTSKEELKEAARKHVLKESVNFDRALKGALSNVSAVERRAALLALEDLPEFKRSHPTVEVSNVASENFWRDIHIRLLFSRLLYLTHALPRSLIQHLTPLLVSSGAAGDAQVTQLGAELVEPGFSYANYKFQSV
jgi:aromatic ring-opening dioxygenase catalytic subunit (LigB family)